MFEAHEVIAGLFAAGLIVGSFLNVCIHRLPLGHSVVWSRSACPRCGRLIRWYDNVPVLSFVLLKGRCRDCHLPISPRYPAVELLAAGGMVLAYAVWGLTPYGLMGMALFMAFIVLTFIDIQHQILPDEITLALLVLGVGFSTMWPRWHGGASWQEGLMGAIIGLVAGGGFLYVSGLIGEWILKKEAMGGGDVKLMAAIGAFTGWPGVCITVFVASLTGALWGLALRFWRGQDRIPFGPFLMAGVVLYLLWGDKIFAWYLHDVLKY